jgi:endonuclease/exonuclease/phosphatase (EEP) superfamily protein YafD
MPPFLPRTRPRRALLVGILAVLPWSWFLVRNLGWPAEVVAVAFPLIGGVLIVVLGIVAFAMRRIAPLAIASSLLILTVVVTSLPRMPVRTAPPRSGVRLLSANVYELNREPQAAAAALASSDADIVVAVEPPPGFGRVFASSDPSRTYAIEDTKSVIHSRFPIESAPIPSSLPPSRLTRAIVQGPAGPFVLYAVHAFNPAYESTFTQQLTFVARLRHAALGETMPVVIAGDFNMSDRQQGYRDMTSSFRDADRAGWAADTYDHGIWRALLLRIDYVFIEPSWCAADAHRVDVPGSDHEAVEATVGPCPG